MLEILGVFEGVYILIDEVVICIGEVINVDIKLEDIEILYKFKRKIIKFVIVKFVSYKVKFFFYKVRIKFKNVKIFDIFLSDVFLFWEDWCIFINENFMNYWREFFWKVNKMKKDNMIINIWIMDGKIFVKILLSGVLVRIYCEEDLDDF